MNIKSRPLLIAAGISFGVQLIFTLISTVPLLFIQFNPQTLERLFGLADTPAPSGAILGGLLSLGLLACLCPFVLDGIAGGVYAFLHNRIEAIDLQDGILGGAASGALGRILATAVGTAISVLMMPLAMSQFSAEFASPGMPTAGLPPGAMAIMAASSVISGIFGIIIGAVSGAVMGSIGGGITAAVLERKD